MRSGRWAIAALGASVLLLAAAPGLTQTPKSSDATPKRGGVFRMPAPEPPTLDPHLNAGFTTHLYATLIYNCLVRLPAGPELRGPGDHRILPDLAEKWESTNPTTIVFKLRRGVRFHNKPPVNGREVTADDVKYSLERFRARSAVGQRLEPVQSIDVLDRHTVRLVLREPYAPLLNHLSNTANCAILPREAEERFRDFNSAEASIGTGPFVLRSYERGVRAIYERNPHFHMPGLPYLDGVSVEVVPENATRLSMLRAGKLEIAHWWGWLTPEEGRSFRRSNPDFAVTSQLVMDVAHIYMRTDQLPFNDVRVRRAVSLAIDRKAWRESLHYGEGCLDSGPVPCAMASWKLDANTLEPTRRKYLDGHDPVEAKRLLAEAGFGRGLSVPLAHWPGFAAPWRSYYELTVDNLAQVGINAELKPEDTARYSTMTFLGKYDKMAMGPFGAGTTEIDEVLHETFFSASPRNRSRVNDPELDRMLLAQRRELDPARRREIVLDIQRYLADKAYYVYLPMWPRYIVHPAYVKGFRNHDGYGVGSRLMFTWFDR